MSRPLGCMPHSFVCVSWPAVGAPSRGQGAISGLRPARPAHLLAREPRRRRAPRAPLTLSPLSRSPTWQWFRDGAPLPEGRGTYAVSSKERSLTLRSASPDDNGVYSCCARSAVGSVCSQDNFTLNIVGERRARLLYPLLSLLFPGISLETSASFRARESVRGAPGSFWGFLQRKDHPGVPLPPGVSLTLPRSLLLQTRAFPRRWSSRRTSSSPRTRRRCSTASLPPCPLPRRSGSLRTTPSPTDPSNGDPGDVGRAGGHAEGPSPGRAFRISHRGACPARLGPAEPCCFRAAFPCVALGKQFVPEGVCGAGNPKYLCTMICRAWGISQPGRGARSGGFGARDLAAGRCHLGARCPVARQLPGATLCPLFPFSGVPLPTKAISAPKKSLFLSTPPRQSACPTFLFLHPASPTLGGLGWAQRSPRLFHGLL